MLMQPITDKSMVLTDAQRHVMMPSGFARPKSWKLARNYLVAAALAGWIVCFWLGCVAIVGQILN